MILFSQQVIFIAKRHIAAGEEVTDCYGIHHLSLPRNERLAALVSRKTFFKCILSVEVLKISASEQFSTSSLVEISEPLPSCLSKCLKNFLRIVDTPSLAPARPAKTTSHCYNPCRAHCLPRSPSSWATPCPSEYTYSISFLYLIRTLGIVYLQVQGWAKELSLGCVNSHPTVSGSQEAGFT